MAKVWVNSMSMPNTPTCSRWVTEEDHLKDIHDLQDMVTEAEERANDLACELHEVKETAKRLDKYLAEMQEFIIEKFGVETYNCVHCGKVFTNVNALFIHNKKEHR